MTAPPRSAVQHLDEALGMRTTAPRLSWKLPAGARKQHAYRITADNDWDTGRGAGVACELVRVEYAQHLFDGCNDIDAVVPLSIDYLAKALR